MKAADLTGQRFGRLVATKRTESRRGHAQWLCRCDCGSEKAFLATHLKRGNTTSCGCYAAESSADRKRKHGMTDSKEHRVWRAMRERCHNPRSIGFAHYGGRGITVCDRWRESFEHFLADMGQRPDGMTIDRIDTNGNYEPGNCRWATQKEQQNNRTNNRLITKDGETMTLSQLADRLGIPQWKARKVLCDGHVI